MFRRKWVKRWHIALLVFGSVVSTFIYVNLSAAEKTLKYEVKLTEPVTTLRFEKSLGELMGPAFTAGNEIITLKNGEEIFPAMLKAIRSAKKTITFESYIYWSGDTGNQFVEALCDRARHGVKIHVLLDWAGSEKIDPDYIRRLKSSGVEVERYHAPAWYNLSHMNNRTHRKILVVDGEIAFTGGVGIADEWNGNGLDPKKWRDTHYQVRGPVVAQMQSAFFDNWMKMRPEIHLSDAYFPELAPVATKNLSRAQMFKSSSREGGSSVHIMYILAIAAAVKSIRLESAYFVPDEVTIQQLIKARERGVRVEIIVPGPYTDSDLVGPASRDSWGELLQAGVQIYEYQPAMFHCKVLVIDDYFVSVGSTNFDERSFKLNDEANLNILGAEVANEQEQMFEADRARSREITLAEWKARSFWDRVMEKLALLIKSQL